MTIKKIAIIGLGLMGGSLAGAIRRKFLGVRIVGISRSREALAYGCKKGWLDESHRDLSKGVRGARCVVLCTPVDVSLKLLKSLDRLCEGGTLVTDVGSVKGPIQKFAESFRFKNIAFVGAHPMVGSHERGMFSAQPDLYDKGTCFLISEKSTSPEAFKKAQKFWSRVCSKVVVVSAKTHDRIVSEISHLPHALAVSLLLAVSPENLVYAASGFRDSTRIAAGDPSIWLPIFLQNTEALVRDLRKLEKSMKELRQSLLAKDQKRLLSLLRNAVQKRSQISL